MNLAATLGLNSAGFTSGLDKAGAGVGGFKALLSGIAGPLAAITSALAGVAVAGSLVKSSIAAAANMENLEGSFTTLLGSVSAAKTRMKDLADFANTTPFELNGVAQASKLLQAFTGPALSTGDGLRLVGDAAAAVGQPLEAVSMWFGRLYAGLKDGQPLGEPIQNLTQLGLISSEARKSLMALQGQALSSAETMRILHGAFGANAGAMARLASTYDGKLSTMQDAWTAFQVELGTPIKDALKPFLDSATASLAGMAPAAQKIGKFIGDGLTVFRQAWEGGDIGGLISDVLSIAFGKGVNFFAKGLNGVVLGFGSLLDTMPGYLAAAFGLYTKAEFWTSVAQLALGAFQSIGGELINIFTAPITAMQAAMDTLVQRMSEGLGKMPKDFNKLSQSAGFLAHPLTTIAKQALFGEPTDLTGFKADSFETNRAYREKNGVPLIDAGTQSAEAGAKNLYEGGVKIIALTKELREATVTMGTVFGQKVAEGYKNGGGLFTDFIAQAQADLDARIKRAQAANAEAKNAAKDPAAIATSPMSASLPKGLGDLAADRLTKIGGFIGGSGGPALDYARRTAISAEKTVTGIYSLMTTIGRLPVGDSVARFA